MTPVPPDDPFGPFHHTGEIPGSTVVPTPPPALSAVSVFDFVYVYPVLPQNVLQAWQGRVTLTAAPTPVAAMQYLAAMGGFINELPGPNGAGPGMAVADGAILSVKLAS